MRTSIKYQVGSETLQEILIASLKAEASYEHLMNKTVNQSLYQWLEFRKEATTDFILKVLQYLEEMKVPPVSYSGLDIKIHHLLSDIKFLFLSRREESLISSSLSIDEKYLENLYKVLKHPTVTDNLYQLYRKQIDLIRNSAKEFVQSDTVVF